MTDSPDDKVDPQCPEIDIFLTRAAKEVVAVGMTGLQRHEAIVERFNAWTPGHRAVCQRCSAYRGSAAVVSGRSPVWGGATIGFVIGLIVGLVRRPYLETVIYATVIGTIVGFASKVLAGVGSILGGRSRK